jgi:histidine triad (HIT) family protein
MAQNERNVFERIIDGEIPADVVRDTPHLLAFRDISPQAPVHVLIVPKISGYQNVAQLAEARPELLAEIVYLAQDIAREEADGDFRLVFNSGEAAGQTVFHVHAHVLAGGLAEGSLAH